MKTAIHPTAVIHPEAELHSTVRVGAYATIGKGVRIGRETVVGDHAIVEGPAEIGDRNRIFPGAAIGLEPQDRKYSGAPSAVIIGNGNRIREYVTINRATAAGEVTRLGDDNLLMAYVHVAHNCVLEDRVVVANNVALAGHVYIESQATIGGMLGIHQFVRVGRLAMIGGMSRIDRDVPPYMLVEGNPARVRSLNRVGLQRAGLADLEGGRALQGLKEAYRLLYRSGLSLDEALAKLELQSDCEPVRHLRQFLDGSRSPDRRGPIPGRRSRGA